MKRLPGEKSKRIYKEFISQYLPKDIENWTYVEPFGGTFAINSFLPKRPKLSIYNDIKKYDFIDDIVSDEKHHVDWVEIITQYDSEKTIFYLDPPYLGKEYLYGNIEPNQESFLHVPLMNKLSKIKGIFILSYESCDGILNLYKDFNIFNYNGYYVPLKKELLITNHNQTDLRKLKLTNIKEIEK